MINRTSFMLGMMTAFGECVAGETKNRPASAATAKQAVTCLVKKVMAPFS